MRFSFAIFASVVAFALPAGAIEQEMRAAFADCAKAAPANLALHPEDRSAFFGGLLHFYGICREQNRIQGIVMVERSAQLGYRLAAPTLAFFHETIGDMAQARKWAELAALINWERTDKPIPPNLEFEEFGTSVALAWRELRDAILTRDIRNLTALLERMEENPSPFKATEWDIWNEASYALIRAGSAEGYFWWAWGAITGRMGTVDDNTIARELEIATLCEHPRAIRAQAKLYIAGQPAFGQPERIVEALARLHHVTGIDGELLAAAEAKLGHRAYASTDALISWLEKARRECRDRVRPHD